MAFLLEKMVFLPLFRWLHRRALWPISRCNKHKFSTDCPNWSWKIWFKRLLSRFQIDTKLKSSDFNNLHLFRYFWRQFECWSKTPTWNLIVRKLTSNPNLLFTTLLSVPIHHQFLQKPQDHEHFQTFKWMSWEDEFKYTKNN